VVPAPLRRILLLDGARRGTGTEIEATPLGVVDAAGEIFRAGFFGVDTRGAWQRQLAVTMAIAESAVTGSATVPLGIEALAAAAGRYTDAIRS